MIDVPRGLATAALAEASRRGAAYLLDLQGADGSWTDLWLAPGASDAWVTALVGTALIEADRAGCLDARQRVEAQTAVAAAAEWLATSIGRRGGWGYNSSVPPDADSTAWAVTCLALAGRDVPPDALRLLARHRVAGVGARTYLRPGNLWSTPLPDVAAAVLRAEFEAGVLGKDELAAAWLRDVAPAVQPNGFWPTYWWSSTSYPSALAADVWAMAGRPGPVGPWTRLDPPSSAFEQAWRVILTLAVEPEPQACWPEIEALLDLQDPDGGWPFGRFLVVPSPVGARSSVTPPPAGDARRLLTTGSALMALARAARRDDLGEGNSVRRRVAAARGRLPEPARSELGRRTADLVGDVARAVGFPPAGAREAAAQFARLTRETFAEPTPWPAAQLSSLGSGIPLEFSVTAGTAARSALRYAVEVGEPLLPAQRRARSAVSAVRRVATELGYGEAWERVALPIDLATWTGLRVADRCRFWVWSGIDQALGPDGQPQPSVLKVYLSLLESEVGDGRARLDAMLAAAGIPVPNPTASALEQLDAVGFPHEVGFGLAPRGRVAVKVYYELLGWRPDLVATLLERSGAWHESQSGRLADLAPIVPGVLGERLAAKSRAGIALRLDVEDGSIRELTTAAAFPAPLAGNGEIARRILGWVERQGWRSDYAGVARTVAPGIWGSGTRDAGVLAEDLAGPLHSLLTRTVTRSESWTTIYLRPRLRSEPRRASRWAA